MITLRQHAISLAAVFLALAVGVILGSGLLNDTLLSGLREDKRSQQRQIEDLNQDKNALNENSTRQVISMPPWLRAWLRTHSPIARSC